MLSTAYSFIKHYNPSADVRLFGQEFMPQSYAVGLAEMMIKGQNIENFRNADTFKEDCFPNIKMRFVLEIRPSARRGQEKTPRPGRRMLSAMSLSEARRDAGVQVCRAAAIPS